MGKPKLPSSACDWHWRSVDPSQYGSPLDRIREALGIKGTKIPQSMHGEFKIDGWNVVVKRGAAKPARGRTAKHRIYVRYNGDLIPAGRVRQALCQTDLYTARRRAAKARGPKGRFQYKRRSVAGRRRER